MKDKFTTDCQRGFTFLELIISIVIIYVLTAIVIPKFYIYRGKGFDAVAVSVMKQYINAEEAYYVDFQVYADEAEIQSEFTIPTSEVTVNLVNNTVDWSAQVYHPQGNKTYCFNSITSGDIEELDGAGTSC